MMRNRPEFHVADIGVAAARRDPGLDLQLLRARAGPVPRVALRRRGRDRRGRRLPRADPQGARRAPDARARRDHRRRRARARRRAPLGRAARRATRSTSTSRRRSREARRPRDHHLHVGHDRPAEGRDARPREHRVDRREPPRAAGPTTIPIRACSRMVSYLPMAHIAERMVSHYQGLVAAFEVTTLPRGVADRRVPRRGAPRDLLRCPAHLGEAARRGARRRARRPGPAGCARRRDPDRRPGRRRPGAR